MDHPALPAEIVVLPGTDVDGAWERFQVSEALHHSMSICSPATGPDLDEVLGYLDLGPDDRMLDVACGHGELLIRAAGRTAVDATGLDLSPWVLVRAIEESHRRDPAGSLSWWLGDGKDLPRDQWDVLTCLGASWIWNGFSGTAMAAAARTRPGGAVAIGDLVLKQGFDPAGIAAAHGRVLTLDDQRQILRDAGIDPRDCIVASDAAFDAYEERVALSAAEYARLHPGEPAERCLADQRQWAADHRRDREFLTRVIWVGRRAGTA